MRLILFLSLSFAWATSQAQIVEPIYVKVGLQNTHIPQFNVQEASDSNIRTFGVRLMAADFNIVPVELGVHAYSGFGDVAGISFGTNLAYIFADLQNHYFKAGLEYSKINLGNVNADDGGFGPNVGDVRFAGWSTKYKPYLEWEWTFSRFTSLFLQAGYHIVSGDKAVVTEVEATDDPIFKYRVSERERSFFYSASGYDVGVGISIMF